MSLDLSLYELQRVFVTLFEIIKNEKESLINHDGGNGKGIILQINGSSLLLPLNMALVCISFQSIGYSGDIRDDPLS